MLGFALCVVFVTSSRAAISVDIEGVSGAQLDNVRAYLTIHKVSKQASKTVDGISDFAVERMHGKAGKEIVDALMPFGYYSPEIESVLVLGYYPSSPVLF